MSGTTAGLNLQTREHLNSVLVPEPIHLQEPQDFNSMHTDNVNSEAARQLIDADVRRLEDSIRDLKSRRNLLAPVSRLPPEMLSKIFIFCTFDNNNPAKPLGWIKITHISRHWRDVALDCPGLWANIITTRPKWTEEMLKRSKSATLNLDVDLNCTTPKMVEAAQLALQHTLRMKELKLNAPCTAVEKLLSDLPMDVPRLQSLSLSASATNRFGSAENVSLPKELFSGDSSYLRKLELNRCSLDWNSPLFSGLTALKICHTSPHIRPTMLQLTGALERMPLLETLHLQEALPTILTEETSSRTVHLRHLSHIHVFSTVPECAHLLNHIVVPSNLTYAFNVRGTEVTKHDFSSVLHLLPGSRSSNHTKVTNRVKPIRGLSVRVLGSSTVVIRGWTNEQASLDILSGTKKPQIELSLDWRSSSSSIIENVLADACKVLPLTQVKSVNLALSRTIKTETWTSVFGNLPRLQEIHLVESAVNTLVAALREEPPPSESVQSLSSGSRNPMHTRRPGLRRRKSIIPPVYFPKLHTLSLEDADFDDALLSVDDFIDCLMERSEKKVAIQVLRLSSCFHLTSTDVEQLQQIVPEVDWDELEQGYSDEEDFDDEYGFGYDDEDYSLDEDYPTWGYGGYESPIDISDF